MTKLAMNVTKDNVDLMYDALLEWLNASKFSIHYSPVCSKCILGIVSKSITYTLRTCTKCGQSLPVFLPHVTAAVKMCKTLHDTVAIHSFVDVSIFMSLLKNFMPSTKTFDVKHSIVQVMAKCISSGQGIFRAVNGTLCECSLPSSVEELLVWYDFQCI